MEPCPFCTPEIENENVVLANDYCLFLQHDEPVLIGSGIIVPRAHRENVFDLTPDEWTATYHLLNQVKALLDEKFAPHGYNLGWNCGETGGQAIFHAHLHVIPRYDDEPYAGKGIRHWLKQDANRRPR